jgi:hypothetical protein
METNVLAALVLVLYIGSLFYFKSNVVTILVLFIMLSMLLLLLLPLPLKLSLSLMITTSLSSLSHYKTTLEFILISIRFLILISATLSYLILFSNRKLGLLLFLLESPFGSSSDYSGPPHLPGFYILAKRFLYFMCDSKSSLPKTLRF